MNKFFLWIMRAALLLSLMLNSQVAMADDDEERALPSVSFIYICGLTADVGLTLGNAGGVPISLDWKFQRNDDPMEIQPSVVVSPSQEVEFRIPIAENDKLSIEVSGPQNYWRSPINGDCLPHDLFMPLAWGATN